MLDQFLKSRAIFAGDMIPKVNQLDRKSGFFVSAFLYLLPNSQINPNNQPNQVSDGVVYLQGYSVT